MPLDMVQDAVPCELSERPGHSNGSGPAPLYMFKDAESSTDHVVPCQLADSEAACMELLLAVMDQEMHTEPLAIQNDV